MYWFKVYEFWFGLISITSSKVIKIVAKCKYSITFHLSFSKTVERFSSFGNSLLLAVDFDSTPALGLSSQNHPDGQLMATTRIILKGVK